MRILICDTLDYRREFIKSNLGWWSCTAASSVEQAAEALAKRKKFNLIIYAPSRLQQFNLLEYAKLRGYGTPFVTVLDMPVSKPNQITWPFTAEDLTELRGRYETEKPKLPKLSNALRTFANSLFY